MGLFACLPVFFVALQLAIIQNVDLFTNLTFLYYLFSLIHLNLFHRINKQIYFAFVQVVKNKRCFQPKQNSISG